MIWFMWGTLRGTFLQNLEGTTQINISRFPRVWLQFPTLRPICADYSEHIASLWCGLRLTPNGPYRTFDRWLRCCSRSPHSGHWPMIAVFPYAGRQLCGTEPQFAAAAPRSAFLVQPNKVLVSLIATYSVLWRLKTLIAIHFLNVLF